MTFAELNLHEYLLKALTQCGYEKPTPIQAQAIPLVMAGKDIIASAQTGTGKTAAFLLPALHNILTKGAKHKQPKILVLTPTRELAQQIEKAAQDYSRCIRLSAVSLVGGMPYPQQIRALNRPLDLVIATPGRLMDHLERNRIDLTSIDVLVLDEADRMLDMGFIDDVQHIASLCNRNRQTLLFSATIDNKMEKFANTLLKEPARIKVEVERTNNRQIEQSIYMTDGIQHKSAILSHILQQEPIFKGIIFTATKSAADELADTLYDQGIKAAAMHGDMKQSRRIKTLEQLRNGRLQLIVATDVAARGIDINNISHVINFDLPKFAEDYVHRIGRTGRAGQSGKAITFVAFNERSHLQKIEKYIGQSILPSVVEGLEPKTKVSADKPKARRGSGKPQSGRRGSARNDAGRGYAGRKSVSEASNNRNAGGYAKSKREAGEGKNYERNAEGRVFTDRNSAGRTSGQTKTDRFTKREQYAGKGRAADGQYAVKPQKPKLSLKSKKIAS